MILIQSQMMSERHSLLLLVKQPNVRHPAHLLSPFRAASKRRSSYPNEAAMTIQPLTYTRRNDTSFIRKLVSHLRALRPEVLVGFLADVGKEFTHWLAKLWTLNARSDQLPPNSDWLIWLLLGGRGSGKTRAGAEWVRERVKNGARRIALVAPTYAEAREVMIEGESGLLSIGPPEERPVYLSSRRRLEWPGGAIGQIFSSEDPDGLRGPQFDTAWADEFCAWENPEDTLSNLRLGLRLPHAHLKPQLTLTTTPKPRKSLTKLMKSKGLCLSRARTHDNADNLSPAFIEAVQDAYGGTRLGRQELGGEIMTDHAGALWTRAMIERACEPQGFTRQDQFEDIIVAIDPPVSSGPHANACGIIVAGLSKAEGCAPPKAVILHDGTVQGRSPENWARQAADLYDFYHATRIVAEGNQGGDMVRTVLREAGQHMPLRLVHAARSKTARAAPVAFLYEQGRVHHMARFEDLEDELCQMGSENPASRDSPDRADALVWAVTELLLSKRAMPRVRVL